MGAVGHFLSMMDAVKLPYHNRRHAELGLMFCRMLSRRFERELDRGMERQLEVAMAAHDIGYLWKYGRNEKLAARYATKALRIMGMDMPDVPRLILATIPEREAEDRAEMIMKECDIAYVASPLYFFEAEMLRLELAAMGNHIPRERWREIQVEFLSSRRFSTEELEKGRKKNLSVLMSPSQACQGL